MLNPLPYLINYLNSFIDVVRFKPEFIVRHEVDKNQDIPICDDPESVS
jgi:hypothetical protein